MKCSFPLRCFLILVSGFIIFSAKGQEWHEQQRLWNDFAGNNNLGSTIDIYEDILVTGSYNHDYDAVNENYIGGSGAAFIFRYLPGENEWVLEQKIVPDDRTVNKNFGYKVAVHGEYIMVCADRDGNDEMGNPGAVARGSVYVFKKNTAGFWIQIQKLVAPDAEAYDFLGSAIALTDSMAIIGAGGEGNLEAFDLTGAVYVFKLTPDGIWEYAQKITCSMPQISVGYGWELALYENTLVIACDKDGLNATEQFQVNSAGSAYLYHYDGDTWSETQKITASIRTANARFGTQVSIHGDVLAVGAQGEPWDENGENYLAGSGAVYFFKQNDENIWEEYQKIDSPNRESYGAFGSAISLSESDLIVGALMEDNPPTGMIYGRAYAFKKQGNEDLFAYNQTLERSVRHQFSYYAKTVFIDENFAVSGAPFDSLDFDYGISSLYVFTNKGVSGTIFKDATMDCVFQEAEYPLEGHLAVVNPGNLVVQTNSSGRWYLDSLPAGTYTLTVDTNNFWTSACGLEQTFTVNDPEETTIIEPIGLYSTIECTDLSVSIYMPFARPGFSEQYIYVNICNWYDATIPATPGYIDIQLPEWITLDEASIPMESLGDNLFRFEIDTLGIGECLDFNLSTTISPDAVMNQIICIQGTIPIDDCEIEAAADFTPANPLDCAEDYDNSFIEVNAACVNDTIVFTVSNTALPGNGDMACYSAVRLYEDGIWVQSDSVQLAAGQSQTFNIPGGDSTWRLEADQHPLHPGNSAPNATIEACGNQGAWSYTGAYFMHPDDDFDSHVEIHCVHITNSYDPNDKTAVPTGVGENHEILPNGWLDYTIRFQNTGNDTAFTVVLRDTLDLNLDIFTVESGVSSHDYQFQILGTRVLKWTFSNILLPDSTTNEPGSNGFVTFRVRQHDALPDGTQITNFVGIYFDFNEPIITNTVLHTVQRPEILPVNVGNIEGPNRFKTLTIFPNPNTGEFWLQPANPDFKSIPGTLSVYNMQGVKLKILDDFDMRSQQVKLDMAPGIYILHFGDGTEGYVGRVVVY